MYVRSQVAYVCVECKGHAVICVAQSKVMGISVHGRNGYVCEGSSIIYVCG